MADKKTGKEAAKSASKVLKSGSSSKTRKTAAASDLAQAGTPKKTSLPAARAASQVLRDKSSTADAKKAAASDLSQREPARSKAK